MSRKMVMKHLINNSIQAYFAAIEIHNKPKIEYRYETTSILIINAWELILKAFVRKFIRKKSIFKSKYDGNKQETLSLKVISKYCLDYLNSIEKNNFFRATYENIIKIEEYRDNVIHFYNDKIDPIIFSLIAKSSYDYIRFLKKYFKKDIIDDERMYIMPIGFKLPFDPVNFFKEDYIKLNNSDECREFIKSIISCIQKLNKDGIQESIVMGFNVKLDNVRNIKNSDFLIGISDEGKKVNLIKQNKIVLSNDKDAKPMRGKSREDFDLAYPYRYSDVKKIIKVKHPNIKIGREFQQIMQSVKSNCIYAATLGKHPNSKSKSGPPYSYSEEIFKLLEEKLL